jgi:hypothetical protein
LCAVVDLSSGVVTSTNPTGGSGTWQRTALGGSHAFAAVSCPATSLCVAVDSTGNVATSTNPTGGVGAWSIADIDGSNAIIGVACPTTTMCVASDANGNVLTSTNPTGGAGAWTPANVDGTVQLTDVSCPSEFFCAIAARGKPQLVTSTNPTGGASAWTVNTVDSFTGFNGISCADESVCAVVDDFGFVLTGTANPAHTLTVAKGGSGTGTVSSSAPPGIDCGASCSHAFAGGTDVRLSAAPAAGSTFTGWSGGGCSGTGPCVVTLSADTTITATFAVPATPDTVAPTISAFKIAPPSFAVGRSATPVSARAKRGATFSYRLSEPATATITISRPSPGRRSHGKCKAPSRKLRHAKKCIRFVKVGTLTRKSQPAATNHVKFSGRIGRRALRPGKYRASITATDPAGNRSKAKQLTFKIVRG